MALFLENPQQTEPGMDSEVVLTICTDLCKLDTMMEAVSMPNAPTAPTLHHVGFRKFYWQNIQRQCNWSFSEVAMWANMVLMLSTLSLARQNWPSHVPWWDGVRVITTERGCRTVPFLDTVCAYGHAWIPPTMTHVVSLLSDNLTCNAAAPWDRCAPYVRTAQPELKIYMIYTSAQLGRRTTSEWAAPSHSWCMQMASYAVVLAAISWDMVVVCMDNRTTVCLPFTLLAHAAMSSNTVKAIGNRH